MEHETRGRLKRLLPLVLILLFAAWIVLVTLLIATGPEDSGADPTGRPGPVLSPLDHQVRPPATRVGTDDGGTT